MKKVVWIFVCLFSLFPCRRKANMWLGVQMRVRICTFMNRRSFGVGT